MNARRFTTLVNLLKPRELVDADTGQTEIRHERYHRKVPTDHEDASAGTTTRGRQVEANVTRVFTLHRIDDFNDDFKIEIHRDGGEPGEIYEIVGLVDPRGDGQFLEARCARVVE